MSYLYQAPWCLKVYRGLKKSIPSSLTSVTQIYLVTGPCCCMCVCVCACTPLHASWQACLMPPDSPASLQQQHPPPAGHRWLVSAANKAKPKNKREAAAKWVCSQLPLRLSQDNLLFYWCCRVFQMSLYLHVLIICLTRLIRTNTSDKWACKQVCSEYSSVQTVTSMEHKARTGVTFRNGLDVSHRLLNLIISFTDTTAYSFLSSKMFLSTLAEHPAPPKQELLLLMCSGSN